VFAPPASVPAAATTAATHIATAFTCARNIAFMVPSNCVATVDETADFLEAAATIEPANLATAAKAASLTKHVLSRATLTTGTLVPVGFEAPEIGFHRPRNPRLVLRQIASAVETLKVGIAVHAIQ
jgi:hypothetical protein